MQEIIDGKRPEITHDTPECFANLLKRCWDSDPSKRPSITEICNITYQFLMEENDKLFKKSEEKRLDLIRSKKLGPKFSEKPHPKAIFTSRALSSLISKSSSNNSSLTILTNTEQGVCYITVL